MRKVATFEHLENLARKKKSVICPERGIWGGKASPAAFMMQLSAKILHRLFRAGMFVYYPQAKKRKRARKPANLPF